MNKISKEGEYRYHPDRTDSEEFDFRTMNLFNCITYWMTFNLNPQKLASETKRIDISLTCTKPMNELKDFINKTQANYQNIYAPLTEDIISSIEKNKKY
jgi:hypothetical protein